MNYDYCILKISPPVFVKRLVAQSWQGEQVECISMHREVCTVDGVERLSALKLCWERFNVFGGIPANILQHHICLPHVTVYTVGKVGTCIQQCNSIYLNILM